MRTTFNHRDGALLRVLEVDGTTHGSTVPSSDAVADPLGTWWRNYFTGISPEPVNRTGTPIRTAEMFCGPGGFALGAKQACRELGFEFQSRFAIDSDAEATKVYGLNHNTEYLSAASVTTLVDYKIKGSRAEARMAYPPEIVDERLVAMVGAIDLLLAGPPCQGHSNLNNHTRRSDSRNELYLTVPAVAIAAQIPLVVIENVTAVVHDHAGVVETTKELLSQAGYQLTDGVIKADKLGWPQTRSRYFLVARKGSAPIPLNEVATALAEPEAKSVCWAIDDLAGLEPDHEMNRRPNMSPENIERVSWLHDNGEFNLPDELRPDCHKDGNHTYSSVYGRMRPDKPAPTLTTGFLTPGRGRFIHPREKRMLTPREAARLQGFPDTYRWRVPEQEPPLSSLLTKWIGDAVPMPLGYAAVLSALGPGPLY